MAWILRRHVASMNASIEDEVVALLATGRSSDAAALIVERWGDGVYRYFRTLHPNAADDAFSLFCERVLRGVSTFTVRRSGSLRGWTYVVARNAMRGALRSERRRTYRYVSTGDSTFERLCEQVRTASLSSGGERRRALDALREALTAEELALLHLRVECELSWTEVAAAIGESPSAANAARLRKRFQRLLDKLKGRVAAATAS